MRIEIHPKNPQARLLADVVRTLQSGGLICYPTDSTYAYGWLAGQKAAQERVQRLRKLSDRHLYAIACANLRQASEYGKIDNAAFAVLKKLTPGPYTFILPANAALPKRLMDEKRRTIGIRIPDNAIVQALLAELGEPMMTSSLTLPSDVEPYYRDRKSVV